VKALIAFVTVVVLGAVAVVIYVGSHGAEPTVVADPYEAGLRYDEARHAHDVAAVGPRSAPTCQLSRGPCARSVGAATVTLDVDGRPLRTMRDLVFSVRVSPPGAAASRDGRIALVMPGMYMGENRVALTLVGAGQWRGRGVIVRCPTGNRTWIAEVELPATTTGQQPLAASFRFEVEE